MWAQNLKNIQDVCMKVVDRFFSTKFSFAAVFQRQAVIFNSSFAAASAHTFSNC